MFNIIKSKDSGEPLLSKTKRRLNKLVHILTGWIKPNPRPEAADFSMRVPFNYDVPSAISLTRKIAAVCHIFHPDLAPEIKSYLENIRAPYDIFVSTDTEAKAEQIRQAFSCWEGRLDIRIVTNRGRDVAPKLITFKDIYNDYDYVIFLHSKKSEHNGLGLEWRSFLMQNLLGSPAIADGILDTFERDPKLGMVIPQHFEPLRPYVAWGDNFLTAFRLAWRMGFSLAGSRILDFPSGSMFWARPQALRPLLQLNLTLNDFPPEQGQIDGTIAHATERLFLYACEYAGYDWLKVASPDMFANPSTIVPVGQRSDIADFKEKHGVSLLAGNASV